MEILKEHINLSRDEINELIREYQETKDLETKDKIVRAHILFVYKLVRRKSPKYSQNQMDLMLIGLNALSDAIDTVDLKKSQLITYSTRVITWKLNEELNKMVKRGFEINNEDCQCVDFSTEPSQMLSELSEVETWVKTHLDDKRAYIVLERVVNNTNYKDIGEKVGYTDKNAQWHYMSSLKILKKTL